MGGECFESGFPLGFPQVLKPLQIQVQRLLNVYIATLKFLNVLDPPRHSVIPSNVLKNEIFHYNLSDFGRVRSCSRFMISSHNALQHNYHLPLANFTHTHTRSLDTQLNTFDDDLQNNTQHFTPPSPPTCLGLRSDLLSCPPHFSPLVHDLPNRKARSPRLNSRSRPLRPPPTLPTSIRPRV